MGVRNFKILKGVIYAEVDVAGLDNGGWVTMNVKLAKGENTAVTEALATLYAAVEAVAESHMAQASDNRILDSKVEARVQSVRRQHERSLAVQRRTLLAGAAEKVRDKLRWLSDSAVDDSTRTVLRKLAVELEQDAERKSA